MPDSKPNILAIFGDDIGITNWMFYHAPQTYAATAIVQGFMDTFQDFPPRQKPASFTIQQANEAMLSAGQG